MSAESYLLFSKKWSKGDVMWWGPDSKGYTHNLERAGRYSEAEAKEIERATNRDAIAILEGDVSKLKTKVVVDMGYADNWKILNELISGGSSCEESVEPTGPRANEKGCSGKPGGELTSNAARDGAHPSKASASVCVDEDAGVTPRSAQLFSGEPNERGC